jgi:hypothetical protein
LANKHTYDKAQTTTLIFTGVRQGIKDKCNCDNNGNSRDRDFINQVELKQEIN